MIDFLSEAEAAAVLAAPHRRSDGTTLVLTQGTGNAAQGARKWTVQKDSYLFRKAAEGCSLGQIPSDKSTTRWPTGSARDDLTASSGPL